MTDEVIKRAKTKGFEEKQTFIITKDTDWTFLNSTNENLDLLRNLNNKRTVLISHHGTSILEGTYLGFKFISYIKNFWSSNYNLTNKWSNKREYFDLLNKEFKYLKFANKNHIFLIWKKVSLNTVS